MATFHDFNFSFKTKMTSQTYRYTEIFAYSKKSSRSQIDSRFSSRNRSKFRLNLASTLTFAVISWRLFRTWWSFVNASAGHWKRCGLPYVARGPLVAHSCPSAIRSASFSRKHLRQARNQGGKMPPPKISKLCITVLKFAEISEE